MAVNSLRRSNAKERWPIASGRKQAAQERVQTRRWSQSRQLAAASERAAGLALRRWLLHEELRDAAGQTKRPEDGPDGGLIYQVSPDIADTQDDEGDRENVNGLLGCLVMLRHQNASDEEWQALKAIELGRVGASLPALKISKPAARIVIVESAFARLFTEAF